MLRLHPDKRAKASDLMHHNWLEGVVVQGERDVIRRAEEEEKSRKDGSVHETVVEGDEDAMKPVDSTMEVVDPVAVSRSSSNEEGAAGENLDFSPPNQHAGVPPRLNAAPQSRPKETHP